MGLYPSYSDLFTDSTKDIAEGMSTLVSDGMSSICLSPETSSLAAFGGALQAMEMVVLGVSAFLITLKFLKKGFESYVLGTDGDPDADPIQMFISFFKALVVAICFKTLWPIAAELTQDISGQLTAAIGGATSGNVNIIVRGLLTGGLWTVILAIAFLICYGMLYFQFLMRGIELLILRIGFSVACVGLVDADKGIFKSYSNQIVKTCVTVVVQLTLSALGMAVVLTNVIAGVAILIVAIKTPKFLSEFLVPSGGGSGMMSKVSQTAMTINSLKGLIK